MLSSYTLKLQPSPPPHLHHHHQHFKSHFQTTPVVLLKVSAYPWLSGLLVSLQFLVTVLTIKKQHSCATSITLYTFCSSFDAPLLVFSQNIYFLQIIVSSIASSLNRQDLIDCLGFPNDVKVGGNVVDQFGWCHFQFWYEFSPRKLAYVTDNVQTTLQNYIDIISYLNVRQLIAYGKYSSNV